MWLQNLGAGWNAPNYYSEHDMSDSDSTGSSDSSSSDSSSSDSSSSNSESLQSSAGSSESSGKPKSKQVFIKKFTSDQMELWVRLRNLDSAVRTADMSCDVHAVDGSVSKGSIDILQAEKGYSRRFCTWVNAKWVVDNYAKSLLCNEFYHEALLSYAIRIYMADVPMFFRANLVSIDTLKKSLVFRHSGGKDFDKVIHSLTFKQLKSVLLQTLVGIRLAQHRLKLKHHDLHLGNVMVAPCPQSTQVFDTPEGLLNVVIEGYEATIIDFGLSSICKDQAIIRLDMDLLITGDSQTSSQNSVLTEDLGKSWGNWNPDLNGDTGYDYAMFIESVTEQVVLERPLPMTKLDLLSQLQSLIKTSFTSRCRPITPFLVEWDKVWKIFEA